MDELHSKRKQLVALIESYGSCAVAMSAGVDSTVVAKAAALALSERAVAVTGTSASLSSGELDEARRLAQLIGIRHEIVQTAEFDNPEYLRNAPDRCYHCKTELYSHLAELAARLDLAVIVNGANADDLSDFRPGFEAARQHEVRSPLAECHITKAEVRQLAAGWGLPVWDKPAAPCLSSRIAYGEEVTPERLEMVDRGERLLRQLGLAEVRVRYHQGDLARLEVPLGALSMLCQPAARDRLVAELRSLGFKFVTLDLEGFRSGSLNQLIPLAILAESTSNPAVVQDSPAGNS